MGMLEAHEGPMLRRLFFRDHSPARQNAADAAHRRRIRPILQKLMNLFAAPSGMLSAELHDPPASPLADPGGTGLGTSRTIRQRRIPLTVAVQPLVPTAPTDAKTAAQLRDIGIFQQRQLNEFLSNFDHDTFLPRHNGLLLRAVFTSFECVTYVLRDLLTMS